MVYILKSQTNPIYYKIGITNKDIVFRFNDIQKFLPFKVTIHKTIEHDHSSQVESFLHNYFNEKRSNGEWFFLDESDIDKIDDLIVDFKPKYKTKTKKMTYDKPKSNHYNMIDKYLELLEIHKIGQGKSTYKNENGRSGETYNLVGNMFGMSGAKLRRLVKINSFNKELLLDVDTGKETIYSAHCLAIKDSFTIQNNPSDK